MRDEWTERLSEYLDDELTAAERSAFESHLAGCAQCAATLADLREIVDRARTIGPRPPQTDLWPTIVERIGPPSRFGASARQRRETRRFSFTLPQLAAAAVVLTALSSAVAWRIADRSAESSRGAAAPPFAAQSENTASPDRSGSIDREASADLNMRPVSLADAQYDAAVADLEQALAKGRGRLDKATIAIVEENLTVIDQAIAQARAALASDPANSYLSGHLVEARRKKLDLLRRAAALTETD
jgi:Putative zinc-finger